MDQKFIVTATKMNNSIFGPATIVALVFGVATYVFALFIYPMFSEGAMLSAGKIYEAAVWVFCIGMWIYSFSKSRLKQKELLWDAENKTITFNNTIFHISSAAVSLGRYVPSTAKNTAGTILTISDGGNELKLTFISFILPDEQYTTAERSGYAKLYLMEDRLLKGVMSQVQITPVQQSSSPKIEVEITDRSLRRLYPVAILASVALVYVIYFTCIPLALGIFITSIGSGAAILYLFFHVKLVILSIENNILSLTDEKGNVKASCAADQAIIKLYQGGYKYYRSSDYVIISIDFAGSKKIRFGVTGKRGTVLKEHRAGEINGPYSFKQVLMDTQAAAAKPLIEYYHLDDYILFSEYRYS